MALVCDLCNKKRVKMWDIAWTTFESERFGKEFFVTFKISDAFLCGRSDRCVCEGCLNKMGLKEAIEKAEKEAEEERKLLKEAQRGLPAPPSDAPEGWRPTM